MCRAKKKNKAKRGQLTTHTRMTFIAETTRLYLREMSPDDAEQAYLLNADPEVIRYTGDLPFTSKESAAAFLEAYDHYRRHEFGRWAVIQKSNEEFLGWCGLKYTTDPDEHDIGFRFFRSHWGKGFATEAAQKCLELGFNRFEMPVITGRVMRGNSASVRVLEKLGLRFFDSFDFDGEEGLLYRIRKSEYSSPCPAKNTSR